MSERTATFVAVIILLVGGCGFFAGCSVGRNSEPVRTVKIKTWEGNVVAVNRYPGIGTRVVINGKLDTEIGATRIFVAEADSMLAQFIEPGDLVTGDYNFSDCQPKIQGMVGGIPSSRWSKKEKP